MNQNGQVVDLARPIISARKGHNPLYFNIKVQPNDMMSEGGMIQSQPRNETYVLLSALPVELRTRVETAIKAIQSSI